MFNLFGAFLKWQCSIQMQCKHAVPCQGIKYKDSRIFNIERLCNTYNEIIKILFEQIFHAIDKYCKAFQQCMKLMLKGEQLQNITKPSKLRDQARSM